MYLHTQCVRACKCIYHLGYIETLQCARALPSDGTKRCHVGNDGTLCGAARLEQCDALQLQLNCTHNLSCDATLHKCATAVLLQFERLDNMTFLSDLKSSDDIYIYIYPDTVDKRSKRVQSSCTCINYGGATETDNPCRCG